MLLLLAGEDAVEDNVTRSVSLWWLKCEHVLQNVEWLVCWRLAEQQGFSEGRPSLLENSLSSNVVLEDEQKRVNVVSTINSLGQVHVQNK